MCFGEPFFLGQSWTDIVFGSLSEALIDLLMLVSIPGNERADRIALLQSFGSRLRGAPPTITPDGLKVKSKALRKLLRSPPSLGLNRHSLSACTWMRTNRGPP